MSNRYRGIEKSKMVKIQGNLSPTAIQISIYVDKICICGEYVMQILRSIDTNALVFARENICLNLIEIFTENRRDHFQYNLVYVCGCVCVCVNPLGKI